MAEALAALHGCAAIVLSLGGLWDIRQRIIPHWVPGMLLLLAIARFFLFPSAWAGQLAGVLIPGLLLLPTYPKGLRGGDIKLIAALGAFSGLRALPGILFPAAITALLWAKWKRLHSVPFAPFLLAGFLLALIFSTQSQ